jgi:uncharacterized damage-inducible protein DinB
METVLVTDLLLNEFRRRVMEESIPRIQRCLGMLSNEQVWQCPADGLPSVGNLVLHLCGNARQWILAALGDKPDTRQRHTEFAATDGYSAAELSDMLHALAAELENVIADLNSGKLIRLYPVQVFEESGVSILVHVIEHFSYHTGQITLMTRMCTGKHTGYYEGLAL